MVSLSKLKQFASDKDEQTRTFSYCEGVQLVIKPVGTKAYDKAVREEVEKLRRRIARRSKPSQKQLDDVAKKVASKHVLVGWSGLTDEQGNQLQYSPEIAKQLFDESYQFFKDVLEFAGEAETEIREDAEARLGNSSKSSSGISNGELTPQN